MKGELFKQEFNEMATSLEEQLRKKVPLIDMRVARFEQSSVDGLSPDVFSIVGMVTVDKKLLNFATVLTVAEWQSRPGRYLEYLVYKMASVIAEAIVEWQPGKTP